MRFFVLLGLIFFAPSVMGQETGLSFLRIGINARAGSMGDAQAASVRNAFATYWNPAGLADGGNSAAVSHRIWVGDTKVYDIATQISSSRNSTWGLALTATDSGELEARIRPGEADGTFSAQFISAGVSYARTLLGLRTGITVKYLRERIFDTNASGYAVDFGIQKDALDGRLNLGVALRNFGRMGVLQTERTQLPRLAQGGIALSPLQIVALFDETRLLDLMMSIEASHLFDESLTRLHIGCTVTIMNLVDLRGGYISDDELRSYTFGLGLLLDLIDVDYAFIPFEDGFDGPGHILSLLYHW